MAGRAHHKNSEERRGRMKSVAMLVNRMKYRRLSDIQNNPFAGSIQRRKSKTLVSLVPYRSSKHSLYPLALQTLPHNKNNKNNNANTVPHQPKESARPECGSIANQCEGKIKEKKKGKKSQARISWHEQTNRRARDKARRAETGVLDSARVIPSFFRSQMDGHII